MRVWSTGNGMRMMDARERAVIIINQMGLVWSKGSVTLRMTLIFCRNSTKSVEAPDCRCSARGARLRAAISIMACLAASEASNR